MFALALFTDAFSWKALRPACELNKVSGLTHTGVETHRGAHAGSVNSSALKGFWSHGSL